MLISAARRRSLSILPALALVLFSCSANAQLVEIADKFGPVTDEPPPPPIADMRAHIAKVLAEKINEQFLDTTLADVTDYLQLRTRATFTIDEAALNAARKNKEVQFSFTAEKISLGAMLNQTLRQHGLTWTVDDDAIVITTPAGAAARPQRKTYSVAKLADAAGKIDYDELAKVLKQSVEPESWLTKKGEVGFIGKLPAKQSLFIIQTRANQQAIAELLRRLAAPPVAKITTKESPDVDDATKIEKGLLGKAEREYFDVQFEDLLQEFGRQFKFPYYFDRAALAAAGRGDDPLVSDESLKGLTVAAILDRLTQKFGLRWIIVDELLVVTTPEGEAKQPTRAVYSVAKFAAADGTIDYGELVAMIVQSVEPESWRAAGGAIGTIVPVKSRQAIVVTQSYANQRKIRTILNRLAETKP